jgi:hypothetical protein
VNSYDGTKRRALMLSPEHNAQRFWLRVEKSEGCWLWTAALDKNGYGWCRAFGRSAFAHRVAWRLTHGAWPTQALLHSCDNPRCVNPSHLREGTQAENIADAVSRGRVAHGERKSKLKVEQVAEIRKRRASGAKVASLAAEFAVAQSTITRIASGQRWAGSRCQ